MKRGATTGMVTVFLTLFLAACTAAAPSPSPTTKSPTPTTTLSSPTGTTPTPAATPTAMAETPLSPPVAVKVAVLLSATETPIFIGVDKGFFKAEGLNVELVNFAGGGDMTSSLAAGQIDVGGGSSSAGLINAIQRGLGIKIVADRGQAANRFGIGALAIRKDLVESGAYKGYPDLKGKTVAGNTPASSVEFLLGQILKQGNIKPDEVNYVTMPFPNIPAAFANKSIDAAIFPEPFLTTAIDQGYTVKSKSFDEIYPDYQVSVLMYSPKLIQENVEAAKRFAVAYLRGIRVYKDAFEKNQGRADVISVITRYTSLKDAGLVERMIPAGFNADGRVNLKSLEDEQDWYLARGFIKEKIDYSKVVDYQFTDYSLKRLGPYK